jgi:peptidoglycan/xylan/chitin deacetylase (PgdA/CDA1 family)
MAVALTFDDGPDPVSTGAVLRELASLDVRATFFVQADQIERGRSHSDLIGLMLDEGHRVQAHCGRHRSHGDLSPRHIAEDIDRLLAALDRLGAPRPTLWRPPYGDVGDGTCSAASERGLQVVRWTFDTKDFRQGRTATDILVEVDANEALHAESIVLLHDSPSRPEHPRLSTSREVLKPLVDRARARGWQLGVLDGPLPPDFGPAQERSFLLPCEAQSEPPVRGDLPA